MSCCCCLAGRLIVGSILFIRCFVASAQFEEIQHRNLINEETSRKIALKVERTDPDGSGGSLKTDGVCVRRGSVEPERKGEWKGVNEFLSADLPIE